MNKKVIRISRWVLVVLLAGLFISSGYPKIIPNERMVLRFSNWGYEPWFASLVGAIELFGGIALFIPKVTIYAVGSLAIIMLGAIYTHFSTGVGGPEFAIAALVLLGVTGWLTYKEEQM